MVSVTLHMGSYLSQELLSKLPYLLISIADAEIAGACCALPSFCVFWGLFQFLSRVWQACFPMSHLPGQMYVF